MERGHPLDHLGDGLVVGAPFAMKPPTDF